MRCLSAAGLMFFITAVTWSGEVTLTAAADAALVKYSADYAKAKAEMEAKNLASRNALMKVLSAEMERLTKAGNLDGALAVRAKMADLTKNDQDSVSDLLGTPPAPAATGPVAEPADAAERALKIPATVQWRPYVAKTGVRSAFQLGPFPKGVDANAVLSYLAAGDFKKGFLGIEFAKGTADAQGNFLCADQDSTDTFWVLYLKAVKDPVEVTIMAKANPADNTNASNAFLDGKRAGAKATITNAGHIFVLHQLHHAAYRDATIRFLSDQPFLIGAP